MIYNSFNVYPAKDSKLVFQLKQLQLDLWQTSSQMVILYLFSTLIGFLFGYYQA